MRTLKLTFLLISVLLSTKVLADISPHRKKDLLDLERIYFSNFKSIDKIHIYLDADRSNHFASAHSIELGVQLALSEVDFKLWGEEVELFLLDHHGNSSRVKRHLKQFLNDDKALVYFSGIHSPPLIKLRSFINENKILSLVPWAAGGPITRYPSKDNFIFRLSVDDTKAGEFISDYSVNKLGCKAPHLLLEDTAWGDSNLQNMTKALRKYNIIPGVSRFNWNLQSISAKRIVTKIVESGADCIQLVANALEGEKFVSAIASLSEEKRLPIISHWGITGGDFHEKIDVNTRGKIDLSFIQTSFSFLQLSLNDLQKDILKRAIEKYSCIDSAKSIRAPDGFIHSYDLTKILIQASKQVEYESDFDSLRKKLKFALENIEKPVPGLIKEYVKPFKEFSKFSIDAHEALGIEDFSMAKYGDNDEVLLIR